MALDTASRGDFMSNTLEEAMELIENLAARNSNSCADYDKRVNPTPTSNKAMEELTTKVDMLLKAQKRALNFLENNEFDDEEEQTEEINFLGGKGNYQNRGFNPNFRNHPNLSYRITNVENPGDQFYPPRSSQNQGNYQNKAGYGKMGFNPQSRNAGSQDRIESLFQQIMEGKKKFTVENNSMVGSMYNDLNEKFYSLGAHVKILET
ncbi:hypothetical protein V5N11_006022 [Cardamine amara subsp. amara]|uniref:Uncharacterized protein n=1 Tax=Cardamine amara subsp. amara TaxID=228776 RepID=A0ABD1BT76_CARAN